MKQRQAATATGRGQAGDSFSQAVSALMRDLPGLRDLRAGNNGEQAVIPTGVNVLEKVLYF